MGPTKRLANGMTAELRPDPWRPASLELIVDGTPQSHVDLDDPTDLHFEYIRRMGNVIDSVRPEGRPITALHLGAGALTLPRYIHATRPGSAQEVVELDRGLVELVRRHAPWPQDARIRLRYGDARAALAELPGEADVIVVDVFAGATTPPHVTSLEFFRAVVALLAADGVLLVNVADGPPQPYARSQAATVAAAIGEAGGGAGAARLALLGEEGVLRGRRFGNIVVVGAPAGIPDAWAGAWFEAGPHPAAVLTGTDVLRFAGDAAVATDDTATGSPRPRPSVFRF